MGPFGHMTAGFAIRSRTARVPLIVLLLASYFIEATYFIFAGLGMETPQYAPLSHSFGMALVWSIACGGLYALITKNRRNGFFVGLAVFAHWALDIVVWDSLPLAPGLTAQVPGIGLYRILGFKIADAGSNLPTLWVTLVDVGLFTLGLAACILRMRKEKKR